MTNNADALAKLQGRGGEEKIRRHNILVRRRIFDEANKETGGLQEHHDLYYYEVGLPIPNTSSFTYSFNKILLPGSLVYTPFRNQKKIGVVLSTIDNFQLPDYPIKEIISPIFEKPLINKQLITFFRFIADYYCMTLGDVYKTALPSKLISNPANLKRENNTSHYSIESCIEKIYSINPHHDPAQLKPLLTRSKHLSSLWEKLSNTPTSLTLLRKEPFYSSSRLSKLLEKKLVQEQVFSIDLNPEDFSILLNNHQHVSRDFSHLSNEQKSVLEKININQWTKPYLLHGITGSGKTEVYMQVIKQVMKKKKTSLLLLPEISLTPQIIGLFYHRFGDIIAVLHSELTPKERLNQWMRVQKGNAQIIIGTRSSLFAPCNNLGLIIIDEEHDGSFKQDHHLPYHARDMGVFLAKHLNIPIILGSATPSVESYHNACINKYYLLEMKKRTTKAILPIVDIIDMRKIQMSPFDHFSPPLLNSIKEETEKGRQVLLLINRRGYSNYILCFECGNPLMCPNCQISLTFHKNPKCLKCHYCDFQDDYVTICPSCQSNNLGSLGFGTQKIEADLHRLLPKINILRLDRDTASSKGQLSKIINDFISRKADVLIGTQMIAKGHDFLNVTLVGVLNADNGLLIPDFRSSERTFQLLTQVVGRAGRGSKPGKALIQTYNPDHYSITLAKDQNFTPFYQKEFQFRQHLKLPPTYKYALLKASGIQKSFVNKTISYLYSQLEQTIIKNQKLFRSIELIGPTEASLVKIRNKYRYYILFKSQNTSEVNLLLNTIRKTYSKRILATGVSYSLDVDPQSTL